jgi:hypothetical protein
MRRKQPRGQSVNAARCAAASTFALLGAAIAQGSLRALLAFIWVILLIAALTLEWKARRRLREEPAGPVRRTGRETPPTTRRRPAPPPHSPPGRSESS